MKKIIAGLILVSGFIKVQSNLTTDYNACQGLPRNHKCTTVGGHPGVCDSTTPNRICTILDQPGYVTCGGMGNPSQGIPSKAGQPCATAASDGTVLTGNCDSSGARCSIIATAAKPVSTSCRDYNDCATRLCNAYTHQCNYCYRDSECPSEYDHCVTDQDGCTHFSNNTCISMDEWNQDCYP